MSFKDIFKKSFLSQFNSDLSTTSIIMALLITAVIAVYIFAVYRVVCRKAFYSRSFAISLPVIAMITASVIIAVQSSIVISLGMVGALSIVRFRTAVKDPMDLAFLFWSISVGIICGATLYEVAVEASILITLVMLGLHYVPNAKPALILLVNGTGRGSGGSQAGAGGEHQLVQNQVPERVRFRHGYDRGAENQAGGYPDPENSGRLRRGECHPHDPRRRGNLLILSTASLPLGGEGGTAMP